LPSCANTMPCNQNDKNTNTDMADFFILSIYLMR
jgi:hypothetical protein